ncbi:transglutaminaseTgpA domain-containing protein [Ornithinimicrobium pratense]|uniref:Transglutaminase domain-containing protein n=1 Tax=Ornithinimicrobium pratense TaxID=2593973 RepID=A0A5J6V4S7_9MICO|nr:DUF3488 and transglutaminase-like domain-containing protein [Ornithinimicrobium pratense]QFG68131.1 transglutaminase domain-containing protein [Ornithinimicrobium pratense]
MTSTLPPPTQTPSPRTPQRPQPQRSEPRRTLLPDQDAFARGMWAEGLVAALATLAVAWPLTGLLREDTWLLPAIALVALVTVSGALMRTFDVPPSLVALGQLLLGIGGVCTVFLRETLWRGLVPTADTLDRIGGLLQQAGTVLQTYAAPAPTTEGVSFLVVSVLTLTAVSVDSMAVTGRAPASAGIPLAAGFLVSVSNTGRAMEPWYFLAVGLLWLVMLAQQSHRVTSGWSSPNRQESRGGQDVSTGPRSLRGLAQVLGASTLVVAILGASALPHLPPTFFGGGLARNTEARTVGGDAAGEVAFTESMDPSQDLRNQSQAPVLRYRTTGISAEPLRVTATERFADGRWQAPDRLSAELLPLNSPLPRPAGVADDVEVSTFQTQVLENQLAPPHLAAPAPLVGLELSGGDYRFDLTDSTAVLQGRAPRYTALYQAPIPGAELPGHVGSVPADPAEFSPDLLAVDAASGDAIAALSEQVVGAEDNALQAAILMQNHFRQPGAYTYSLELTPAAEVGAADPISAFIASRRGYCVQFAQTMVMMARHEGIPARMAVGFLPGTRQNDGSRTVVVADAHTWPELWISGMGWTRFEPTPGARASSIPPWTRAPLDNDQAPATAQPAPDPVPELPEPTEAAAPPADSWVDDMRQLLPTIASVLGLVLVLALLMTVVPLIGRRYRERGLREAHDPAGRVEGYWRVLTRSLADLGVEEPPARSPRVMRGYYEQRTVLVSPAQDALRRATATLERSRYAPVGTLSETDAARMGQDVRAVVDGVRQASPWNVRANAALLPGSGLEGVGHWFAELRTRTWPR